MDSNNVLLKAYHDSHSLVRHHVESFNHFVDVEMKKIVKSHGKIELSSKWFLQFSNINVGMPTIVDKDCSKLPVFPHQCRLRNLTYASDITVDVRYPKNDKIIRRENVIIGRLPIMLRSNKCHLFGKSAQQLIGQGECVHDTGGYFITRGTERVFLMQEQMSKNRMIIERQKITKKGCIKVPLAEKLADSDMVCHVVSFTVENKSKTTVFRNNGYVYVQNSLFTESVPLCVMFAALGMPAHKDIFESIGLEYELHNELLMSAHEAIGLRVFSQRAALVYLMPRIKLASNKDNRMTVSPASVEDEERSLQLARGELHRRVLNHVRCGSDNMWSRAQYLGLMVRRVLLAEMGLVAPDDRDFYGVKRIELVGAYLSLAFEDRFQSFVGSLRIELAKTVAARKAAPLEPCNLIRDTLITDGMFQCVYTGNWAFQRFAMNRSGVTQVLNRLSYIATLGHLGRVSSQFEKVRKISGARAIHLSQYGLVCPSDTPEGEACGLVKNLAFLAEVTVDLPPDQQSRLEALVAQLCGGQLDTFRHRSAMRLVMVNGVPVGWTMVPKQVAADIRTRRRRGDIHEHVSVYYDTQEDALHVCSDSGRLVRPYIIANAGQSALTAAVRQQIEQGQLNWAQLVCGGVVEYLDAREGYAAECLLAANEAEATSRHTHIDINPATALGTVASLIPFPHHNQSPRNTYQCAMGKQALGVVASNQSLRYDGTQHVLVTPQRPLTLSTVARLIQYDQLPAGQNAIVAITCFGGHDIEDALIINKASLERGLFRSLTTKTFTDILKDYDVLGVPAIRNRKQHALELDGTAGIGEFIDNGDVVIHKLTTPEPNPFGAGASTVPGDGTKPPEAAGPKPSPTIYHGSERTQVAKVLFTQEEHGHTLVRVRTSQNRQPEVGDKLSSRHGQKGVIGRVVAHTDMPYTEDGLVPDIIMNPHGFPSRMTVGKLLELVANKAAVLDGVDRDSSAFSVAGHRDGVEDDYPSTLLAHGFSASGKEVLMSGVDGSIMEADIYMGPVFYQRLKHMVQDKVHARATGKNMPLTRQPVVGRAQDGGLRVGEMERDCLIGYGATQILKERMLLSSDPFRAWVCEQCGLLATSKDWCQMCRSSQSVSSVIMPYATKLLMQELMTMQIKPRLTLSRDETAAL